MVHHKIAHARLVKFGDETVPVVAGAFEREKQALAGKNNLAAINQNVRNVAARAACQLTANHSGNVAYRVTCHISQKFFKYRCE